MITQDDFLITKDVVAYIKENPEQYHLHLNMFKSLEHNVLLKWTYETVKDYKNLCLMLAIQERTQEFTVNAYYHLLQLATQYEDIDINWHAALELAKESVKELLAKYNEKKIEI